MSTPTTSSAGAAGLLVDYPLPWHVVAEPACPRLVAANGATVLAADSDETPILVFIATALNAGHASEPSLHTAIAGLAAVLAALNHYPTSDDFIEALIIAAETLIEHVNPNGIPPTGTVRPHHAA